MTITSTLHASNRCMASDAHEDGFFGFCPYDLTQFGSTGISIATSRGRYVWIVSADHPSGSDGDEISGGWEDGSNFLIGYSNDPGVPPKEWRCMVPTTYLSSDPRNVLDKFFYYHFNDLVYNPDDATYPFYFYTEGFCFQGPDVGSNHEGGLLRSADLVTWVGYGGVFLDSGVAGGGAGFCSFTRAKRLSSSSWVAVGRSSHFGVNGLEYSKWVASDATGTWTTDRVALTRTLTSPTRKFQDPIGGPLTLNISGQDYMLFWEDARNGDGGMYATLAAVDSDYNIISSPAPQRLSAKYDGVFPSFGFLQQPHWYIEDGIIHMWNTRGYFSDEANPAEGQHEQAVDYYTAIYDTTAAASAAPVGVRAECLKGAVILEWYDALPNKTYRVYRSTNGGSSYSSLADVTGLHYIDAVGDVGAVYYYKVYTLNAGTEAGFRTVSTYVSNGQKLTNEHVTRVKAAGGTDINIGWLDAIVTWARDNSLTDNLLYCADPSLGVIKDGGDVISTVFCLGSTIHPRGGDYHVKTGGTSTTYNATGLNSAIPAWVNGTSSAQGYFGNTRLNNFRRKVEITFAAVYQKAHTNTVTLMAIGEFGGISFKHSSGSPGSLDFRFADTGYDVTASKAPSSATGAHVAIGTFDGVTQIAYSDGVAGTPATGVTNNKLLDGTRPAQSAGNTAYFLGSGSENLKYTLNVSTSPAFDATRYVYSDAQALFSASALIVFDIALSASQVASLNALLSTRLGGASYTLPAYDTPFVKDIVADYSAATDGTTDVSAAFNSFYSAVQTWQATHTGLVVLQIPVGNFRFQNSTGSSKSFVSNTPHLLLIGQDRATSILAAGATDQGYFLGNGLLGHIHFDNTHSARINTVVAGATSVTLVTVGDAALFTVGKWILIAGIDLQGFGDPPNPGFFEWKKITGISSGTISFAEPLEYSYKSTWPLFNAGGALNSDLGGPATIYAVVDGWDAEHEYRHIGIAQPDGQTKAPLRFVTFTNCSASGDGMFPTENQHWTANDLLMPDATIEVDKIIGTATVKGGALHGIAFQSTSPNKFEMSRGAIVDQMLSTPRRAYLDGFYIVGQSRFGPSSYGCSEKVVALNGTIGSTAIGGVAEAGLVAAGFSMAGGVISVSKAGHGPVQWANPGARALWTGLAADAVNSIGITDISESGGNVRITTDRATTFPNVSSIGMRTHPAPNFTMRGVCDPITDLLGAYGDCRDWSKTPPCTPQYSKSYRKYRYTNINAAPDITLFGQVSRITIVVSTAYTGAAGTLLWEFLGNGGIFAITSSAVKITWNPKIDLRTAGTRVITPSGVIGAVGGDTNLTMPYTPLWMNHTQPHLATDISAENAGPVVSVTIILDQGTMAMNDVLSGVVPLRFRLHA